MLKGVFKKRVTSVNFVVATGILLSVVACSADKTDSASTAELSEALPTVGRDTDELVQGFQNPPNSARPRVWWHWMNGNVTKDGIAKDLAWMKRVGIGGLQNFDANLQTPQIVDERLVYMTPEWKDAFRFAASEAGRLDLELAIASSPGWSETGGPWVPPEDGLKKLVWSETEVTGGKPFSGKVPAPPSTTGPFQTLPISSPMAAAGDHQDEDTPAYYSDISVLAYPLASLEKEPVPTVQATAGGVFDSKLLMDGDPHTAVEVPRGATDKPAYIKYSFEAPQSIQSATVFVPEPFAALLGAPTVQPQLEASDDDTSWQKVADIAPGAVPTTVSFAPVTAKYWRLLLSGGSEVSNREKWGSAPGVDSGDYRAMIRAGLAQQPVGVAEFKLSPVPRIDRFEAKAAFALVPDYFALSADLPEVKGVAPDSVIDLTTSMQPDGTLDWTPPPGKWRVIRLGYSLVGTTNHPATPEATGLEVDKFDGAAVRRYMEHYLGMYADTLGQPLAQQDQLDAILTDSIEVGAANWTPEMIAQFKRLRGYDPVPWLPALTGTIIGGRGQSDSFLYDFRRTLADLMVSEHYKTVAEVAHENGLLVYGEALEDRRPSIGDDMAMRRYTDVPMAAMWTYPREYGPRVTLLADIKGAASVAHIYGQNLVAAESLTSAAYPWAHGPADLKRIIDQEFLLGVNRPVIHTSVHQPMDDKIPGVTLFIFGQYFNRHETWAEMAKPWVDYISRNSYMLQQGRNVADLAYFYGEEAPLTGLYGDSPVADVPTAYGWDFINANALQEVLTNDGSALVTPGGARYQALYLGGSSHQMTLATLERLVSLVEGGATVIGKAPVGSPNLTDDREAFQTRVNQLWSGEQMTRYGEGRVYEMDDVEAALHLAGVEPDFHFSGGDTSTTIPFVHRQLDDGHSYFIVNQRDGAESIQAHFRVTGKIPELWRAETGRSEPVSYRIQGDETIIPLNLAADESLHIVFREPAGTAAIDVEVASLHKATTINGPWTVRFQEGRGAPAQITLETLTPLNEIADDTVRFFSGVATYTTEFVTPGDWQVGEALVLDLGTVGDLAEILVNGKMAGSVWHAPFKLDIRTLAVDGINQLEIRVANLWVNRLIGDAQPDATKITWTPTAPYRADAPLRVSGLIGPVQLLIED